MLSLGQFCYSKAGHDKGSLFLIIKLEDEFVYLADGKRRTLACPKKKKIKHIQIINFVDLSIKHKLEANSYILDADLKKSIKNHINP